MSRMMRLTGTIIILPVLLYIGWSHSGRVQEDTVLPAFPEPELTIEELGNPAAGVRLVGIQPYMQPTDYASEGAFFRKLNSYMSAVYERGLLPSGAVVVFPEHIGTWLVAAGEKKRVFTAASGEDALRTVALSNLPSFLAAWWKTPADDRTKAALFLMKAEKTAGIYTRTFRQLAASYGVTIVGGSVFLPDPVVRQNKIAFRGTELYNATFVFRPDGRMEPLVVRKQYPVDSELPFCRPATGDLPVFNTPAGRLGVAICADSWYPTVYEQLRRGGAEVLAVPSYANPDGIWNERWQGYNGAPMPADVNPADVGVITEEQAWVRYSMGGRAGMAGISYGINVFLRGRIWDLGADGRTIVFLKGNTYLAQPYGGPQATVVRY